MTIIVVTDGTARCLYEEIDHPPGKASEIPVPAMSSRTTTEIGLPIYPRRWPDAWPLPTRSAALAAEGEWLEANRLA